MSKGQEFLQQMSAYKSRQDWDGLLENLYHDDAEVISFDFILRGKEEIKKHYVEGGEVTGKVTGVSMDYFTESDDVVMYKGTISTEDRTIKSDEAFYLKDGKVLRQITLTLTKGEAPPRKYTVRLHFAEMQDIKAGERVFRVAVQGQELPTALDIAKEVGQRTGLVKQFTGVEVTNELVVTLTPLGQNPVAPPILSGIEVVEETDSRGE